MIELNLLSDRTSPMEFRQIEPRTSKRLVEECTAITVWAVRWRFGKEVLLNAIRECRPIEIPSSYNRPFQIWLTYDSHPLVNKPRRLSSLEDGSARIWFVCPQCRRPVAKLFYYTLSDDERVSNLGCRRCHNLTYLSVNCAGNAFYLNVVRPSRHLARIKERLRCKFLPRAKRQALEAQRSAIENYLQSAIEKFGRRTPMKHPQRHSRIIFRTSKKRAYKDFRIAQLPC